MLRSIKKITGYRLSALDGHIGRCKDFLFDDSFWTIRYMVADTANWLIGRKVLISPLSLETPDWVSEIFPVKLTKEQIENAPPLMADAPVSRQFEEKYHEYFGWPYYWATAYAGGAAVTPGIAAKEPDLGKESLSSPHLRSFKEVKNYSVNTLDGDTGHVEDFIVDDEEWIIRFIVVDTRNWLPGRKVLITPQRISTIDWAGRNVRVDLTSERVKNSPEYDPAEPINRKLEVQLYDFYGRPQTI